MSIQSAPPADGDFFDRTGPLSEGERLAFTALSLAHPRPVSMLRILREPESVKDAVYLGMAELRVRGWVRVRGICWSLTTRGLAEAPSSPCVAVLRRIMLGGQP